MASAIEHQTLFGEGVQTGFEGYGPAVRATIKGQAFASGDDIAVIRIPKGSIPRNLVMRVVVPAALSGIVAAIILAMSRAVGETMIVSLAAGQRPFLTLDPRETIATMTSFIVQAATGDQPAGSLASRSLYAVAATLFTVTLLLNVISQAVVRRFRERYE